MLIFPLLDAMEEKYNDIKYTHLCIDNCDAPDSLMP